MLKNIFTKLPSTLINQSRSIISSKRFSEQTKERRIYKVLEENYIIKKEFTDMGIIYLNRPEHLNAINWSILLSINKIIKNWETCKSHVILKSNVINVFSAGADLEALYTVHQTGCGRTVGIEIIKASQKLCYLMANYQKPIISIIDGLAIGKSAGLALNSKYSVVTENTIFATPETSYGNCPDAGNIYKLSKLKGNLGLYLGLTGTQLNGSDLWLTGLATHFIHSNRIYLFTKECIGSDGSDLEGSLDKYQNQNCTNEFSLQPFLEKIDHCFSAPSVEEIIERLKEDDTEWSKGTVKILEKRSPTALKLTKKAFDLAPNKNLEECLKMEYNLAYAALNTDFFEGIRAFSVDKDCKPIWRPETLNEVTDEYIDKLFSSVSKDDELEL